MNLDPSKIGNVTRNPNIASEIGALCHVFREIDVLVLSARRPSLAAPPRGPQVCRTFIGTIPDHLHGASRKRQKFWLAVGSGGGCAFQDLEPALKAVIRASLCSTPPRLTGPPPHGPWTVWEVHPTLSEGGVGPWTCWVVQPTLL